MTDLFTSYDPPIQPPRLAPTDLSYAVTDTAVGRMLVAQNDAGALVASAFVPDAAAEDHVLDRLSRAVSPRVLRQPKELDTHRRELDAYLDGRLRRFSTPVDLVLATPFQRSVLSELGEQAAYGQRTTYGALANEIGRPTAARAVGAALGANPMCIVVPCHRVVAGDGALTGYAGGLAAKRFLLELESAHASTTEGR